MRFDLRNHSLNSGILGLILAVLIVYDYRLLLILLPILLILLPNQPELNVTYLDLGLIAVLIAELLAASFSIYTYNSLSSLRRLLIVLGIFFILKTYIPFKAKVVWLIVGCILGYFINIITIKLFLGHLSFLRLLEFTELNNFKHIFQPLGYLSNEWVSILLVFLPLSLILLIRTTSKELKILASISLIISFLAILLMFSRGAYLSLLVFLTIFITLSYKLLDWKKTILLTVLAFTVITITSQVYKEVGSSWITTLKMNSTVSQKRSSLSRFNSLVETKNKIYETPIVG